MGACRGEVGTGYRRLVRLGTARGKEKETAMEENACLLDSENQLLKTTGNDFV